MSLCIRLPNFILSGAMMSYRFLRWRPLRRNFTSGVSFYQRTKFRSYNSIRSWDITISGLEGQTSAILEFYFRFRFRPYHRSRHVIPHQCAKFHHIGPPTMMSCRFSRWRISAILKSMGPIMGLLKSPCRTSYRLSIETIALNCLVWVNRVSVYMHFGARKPDNKQMNRPNALSRLRYRERQLNIGVTGQQQVDLVTFLLTVHVLSWLKGYLTWLDLTCVSVSGSNACSSARIRVMHS